MFNQLGFHPEALSEYSEAASCYLEQASPLVADALLDAVESAIAVVVLDPTRWRIVEAPEIRRCVVRHFPFVIYYRWEASHRRVTIYSLMHCSREPGYWSHRVG